MNAKFSLWVYGCAAVVAPSTLLAQAINPGVVQKNIEQIVRPDANPVAPAQDVDVSDLSSFDKLAKIEVHGDRLADEIHDYWASRIGKNVSAQEIANFKAWIGDLARNQGVLLYVQTTKAIASDGGESLVVNLVVPTIRSVKIYVPNAELSERYEALLVKRFAEYFKPDSAINLQALDQRLEVVGYELPVNLEVFVRAAEIGKVDLTINVERAEDKPGDFLNGLLQVNNYGLKSYGRPQLVGSFGLTGFTPKSNLILTTQLSDGVRYGRAEYEAPAEFIAGRFKSWYSVTNSRTMLGGASATKADSREYGFGISHLLGNVNSYIFQSNLDLSERKTSNALALNDQEVSAIKDVQFKVRLSVTNDRVTRESDNLDLFLTGGHFRDVRGDSTPSGGYSKFEISGKTQRTLSFDGKLQGVFKFRGQMASQNLDGYNKMALGGMTGVRAYTAADGVGDNGIQGSVELNHQLEDGKSMGIFYDAGLIRPNKSPISGVLNKDYWLQAVGMQWAGNYLRWYYNVTLAKGVGGYKKAAAGEPTESGANAMRLSASMSYVF